MITKRTAAIGRTAGFIALVIAVSTLSGCLDMLGGLFGTEDPNTETTTEETANSDATDSDGGTEVLAVDVESDYDFHVLSEPVDVYINGVAAGSIADTDIVSGVAYTRVAFNYDGPLTSVRIFNSNYDNTLDDTSLGALSPADNPATVLSMAEVPKVILEVAWASDGMSVDGTAFAIGPQDVSFGGPTSSDVDGDTVQLDWSVNQEAAEGLSFDVYYGQFEGSTTSGTVDPVVPADFRKLTATPIAWDGTALVSGQQYAYAATITRETGKPHAWFVIAAKFGSTSVYSSRRSVYVGEPTGEEVTAETQLTVDGNWIEGTVVDDTGDWYYFDGAAGELFDIYWDDTYDGSGVYGADVKVSSYREDRTTSYFTNVDSGFSAAESLTVAAGESRVYLHVEPYFSGDTGTYALKVESVAQNEETGSLTGTIY
jgi:hypothetical protein